MKDKLREYRNKRDLRASGEPAGGGRRGKGRRFVVQEHAASRLHYDFRLEIAGVLVSWAVPKGPSTDPADKRLAVQTENHPLSYVDFEGVIPDGQYGAGAVSVWDTGHYRNLRAGKGGDGHGMGHALSDGLIEIWLEGKKLRGGYVLKRIVAGRKPRWLLIKMQDKHADARRRPVSTQPASVKSGRDIHQISAQESDGKG